MPRLKKYTYLLDDTGLHSCGCRWARYHQDSGNRVYYMHFARASCKLDGHKIGTSIVKGYEYARFTNKPPKVIKRDN